MPALARVLLAAVLIAAFVGPSTTQAQNGGVAAVYASTAEPLDLGLYVTAGQDVAFFTEGTWCSGGTPPDAECGPASGIRAANADELPFVYPVQLGELIGRVRGDDGSVSDWFRIGGGGTWSMPRDGWLEVMFNDQPGHYDDNSGYVKVQAVALSEPYDTGQLDVLERLFDAQNCLTSVNDAYGLNPLVALDVKGFLGGFPNCATTLLAGVDEWVSIWNNCIDTDSRHEICDQLILNWLRQAIDPEGSTEGPPPVQWIEPVDGAKVSSSLTLAAWPTPVLVDGQLTDPTDVARVDFSASWSGGSGLACRAKAAGSDGRWSCTANLEEMGIPAGSFELSFDVLRTDGSTLSAPDGVETVTYDRPPTDPMKYLRAGIPKDVRPTCRRATGTLPPGTIAALDCKPDANAIDTMTYFLMRPSDARATWQERMAEYGLRAGANCAKGKAGIQSNRQALAIGCYKNELGYANLRLASSKVCPSVYVGVLGNTKDIATLWKAYDRVAGEGWIDPGLGGRKDAPSCSGRLPAYAPPGPPTDVKATTSWSGSGEFTAAMRRACRRDGLPITREPGSCEAIALTWKPARGRVDRYEIHRVGRCIVGGQRVVKWEPRSEVIARIDPTAPLSYVYTFPVQGVTVCEWHLEVAAVNRAGQNAVVAVGSDHG